MIIKSFVDSSCSLPFVLLQFPRDAWVKCFSPRRKSSRLRQQTRPESNFPGKKSIPRLKLSTAVDKSSFPGTTRSYPRRPQDYKQRRSAHGEIFFHRDVFFVDKLKCKIYELLLLAHLRQDNLFLLRRNSTVFPTVGHETDDACQNPDRPSRRVSQ
jgi:hypothetical protein